jgi:hypothetical protein
MIAIWLLFFGVQMFKSKFSGWDEVIAVDFTRTAESVQKTGADLTKWARQQETKVYHSQQCSITLIIPSALFW